MLFAIVDIETTGGHAASSGITEIAIVISDGKKVLHVYETLINPQQSIPPFIQSLTGINDQMVRNAPLFSEVAGEIFSLLQDKVFVAHNVNFDYSFVKHYLSKSGYDLDIPKLCSLRLARKVIPGLAKYGLGHLCKQLNIELSNHHRAGGDAEATARLFSLLLEKDDRNVIATMLHGKSKDKYLPPHLPVEDLECLPNLAGVYYFHDRAGKVIYVGKAKNIAKRVKSHFSNNKINKQKQDFLREVCRISYTECATELMAQILESVEIRRLWPRYNRSQKGFLPRFGLYTYTDQNGRKRLTVERVRSSYNPIFSFNSIAEGHERLRQMKNQFGLCAHLCNLAQKCEGCELDDDKQVCCLPIESYNLRVENALAWLLECLPSFAFIDRGLKAEEQSCVLVCNGNFYGMGYVKNISDQTSMSVIQSQLTEMPDNDFIRNLIYKQADAHPEYCLYFS
ncbi:MAG: GIY-YIG nuclease family protein [Bacteroidetes bacterium]|nr:GIY-YIG nuclease family protein [Bacteroidota bacterium]MBS1741198.1 GIY-YIG nuclease family protein [Bacteroidota bacterium]MBS1774830.1 GIY-YIG nuclease family protein [Bacteroidota bacterium]